MIGEGKRLRLAEAVTPEQIEEQLVRMLESGELKLSGRGIAMLKFVVEEAVSGRADYIKGFTIATEVFRRGISFDAQNDPCVRIEAARVRQALERYYLVCGDDDLVEISIPKGGYRPQFSFRAARAAPVAADTASPPIPSQTFWHERAFRALCRTDRPARNVAIWMGATLPVVLAAIGMTIGFSDSSQGQQRNLIPSVVIGKFSGEDGPSNIVGAGFRDELIAVLVAQKRLTVKVAPQGSVVDGEQSDTLNGAVRQSNGVLRISGRLVRANDGVVIRTGRNDYPAADIQNARETSANNFASEVANRLERLASLVDVDDGGN